MKMMALSRILALAGTALAFTATAQDGTRKPPRDLKTGLYTYEEVVLIDSAKAVLLFERGSRWFEDTYQTQDLRILDPNEGKLGNSGRFVVVLDVQNRTIVYNVTYMASLEVREGRYKYRFSDFQVAASGTAGQPLEVYCDRPAPLKTVGSKKVWKEMIDGILDGVDRHLSTMIDDLRSAMDGRL
jgi:hypothetical protein